MLMPPNSTRSRLTFASSGLVGVYSGRSVTSWPRASSSTASALSREQLPQYIPAAPAVIERIRITTPRSTPGGALIEPPRRHEGTKKEPSESSCRRDFDFVAGAPNVEGRARRGDRRL